jgi:hypothetical protein
MIVISNRLSAPPKRVKGRGDTKSITAVSRKERREDAA